MDNVTQDLRYALRQLFKRPAFTSVAALTLALGIGANTAIFSVVNSVLLRPLPYEESDEIVAVWNTLSTSEQSSLSEPELLDYRREIHSFQELAAYRSDEANLTGSTEPERVQAAQVTANLFDVLGVPPQIGRTFAEEEDLPGGPEVAVLGHGLWQRRFGGDPTIVGKSVQVNGRPTTVVGVMPPDFKLPADFGSEVASQLWLPLALDPEDLGDRGRHYLQAVARLRPGATVAQANAELEVVTRRWVADGIVSDQRFSTSAVPIRDEIVGDVRPALLILFAAVGFVLLIACANVANLLLTRADERQKELAVRTALGAERGRIVRQLLTESLVLAGLGGIAALLVAYLGLSGLTALAPTTIPGLDAVTLDAGVLGFTVVLTVIAGIAFGALPALQAERSGLSSRLREGGRNTTAGRSRQRARRSLVVAEVALAMVLVIGAGLLLRSFLELRQVALGFEPQNVLTFQVTLPGADYPETEQMIGFYRQARERLEALPGVRTAGAAALLPLSQTTGDWGIDIAGRVRGPENRFHGHLQIVTPGYFETMQIPLVSGRLIDEDDRLDAAPAVLINQSMAARYWPYETPMGRRIRIRSDGEGPWFTIVGVVGDIRHNALTEEPKHEMYFPHAQLPLALGGTTAAMNVVVRTASDPLAVAPSVRGAIESVDPNLPIARVRSMEQVVDSALAEARFIMALLAGFAALALLLGAVGIYGVITYTVARRHDEIGIRMALGAERGGILRMVVGQALAMVVVGLALGLFAAFAVTQFLSGLLYGVGSTDPITFVAVPVLFTLVALIAAYLPARRAARVDPVTALKAD